VEPAFVPDRVIEGDCLDVLACFPDACVDLVVTSPPYADKRSHTYGGIEADKYVGWFLPRSAQFLRVLRPSGSFVLNIKEGCKDGERQTYVMELVMALRRQGWLWVEEYIWHKATAMPGKWPNRFRDAWEHCYHFTKQRSFSMHQEAVMVPAAKSTVRRAESSARADGREDVRKETKTGSGFGRNRARWIGKDMVLPTNVVYLSPEFTNQSHSAVFPVGLPEWFIRLFTLPGETVLDPFCGSGTTCLAAKRLGRHWVGIETVPGFVPVAEKKIEEG